MVREAIKITKDNRKGQEVNSVHTWSERSREKYKHNSETPLALLQRCPHTHFKAGCAFDSSRHRGVRMSVPTSKQRGKMLHISKQPPLSPGSCYTLVTASAGPGSTSPGLGKGDMCSRVCGHIHMPLANWGNARAHTEVTQFGAGIVFPTSRETRKWSQTSEVRVTPRRVKG